MEFSLWKQLKRRLRRRRRPLWTLGTYIIGLLAATLCCQSFVYSADMILPAAKQEFIDPLASYDGILTVRLKREYICGEENIILGDMNAGSIIKLLREHPEWTAAAMIRDGEVLLLEKVEDLSDECKQNAFFSIDKLGNLSLFDGPPANEKVIRTFFQLDVTYMESSLPKERLESLNHGIRVSDIAEFNSVISTFSEFAYQPSREKVMKPAV